MTKCPYVPPHEFNIDFPHLMLRYRTFQDKQNKLPKIPKELAKIDRNANLAKISPTLANWSSDKKNSLTRRPLEMISGIDKDAELPKFEKKTFHELSEKIDIKVNASAPAFGRRVAIYSTCYVNFNNSKVGIAAQKVLNHNGVETISSYPGCCGMPHLEQAQHEKVIKQSEIVSKELCSLIDQGYQIVTLTASCGLMLKFEWPLLNPNNENVKKLSKNVFDIDEFIVDISKKEGLVEGLNSLDGGVTVHNACHARAQNMGNKAMEMLKKLPDTKVDVVEKCAGHGGTFGVMKKTRKSANKYGKATARQIKNKKNKLMVSDCPLACKHLNEFLNEDKDSNYISMHPIENVIYQSSPLIHFLVPSDPIIFTIHMILVTLNPAFTHSGFEKIVKKETKILDSADFHHQLHHRYFDCNYGNMDVPLDVWFGTDHDGSEAATLRLRDRKRKRS